ncbi:MAG: hypothetical protein ACR2OV_00340 [Hyphomicrobiaceae bacterium]
MRNGRLAELREADAPPAIVAIYEEIKRATGIPQVNLIFRHLATVPGMLAWTWERLGPLYVSGQISDCAGQLTETLPSPKTSGILQELDADDRTGVSEVLRFYNHANRHNLVALTTLANLNTNPAPATKFTASDQPATLDQPQVPRFDVPNLPKLDELPVERRKLVVELASHHGASEMGAVPSMYLHMAVWPAAIALTHRRVVGLANSGSLARDAANVINSADELAGDLTVRLAAADDLPETPEQIAALERIAAFVKNTIPEMVVVGHTLAAD